MAERPTPAAVMRTLREHQPTIFCGVPTLFASMLAHAGTHASEGSPRAAREHLRGRGAAQARRRDVARALRAPTSSTASARPSCCTSSCRTGPATCATAPRESRCPATSSSSSATTATLVADGEEGSLWVRGPSAASAYWNQRETKPRDVPRPVDAHRRSLRARRRRLLHVLGPRRRHAQGRRHLGLAVRGRVARSRRTTRCSRRRVVGACR